MSFNNLYCGTITGLAVTFNIQQDEYVGDIAQEAGVRVVVHSRDRMPFPEDEGVSVIPGQMTYIGMRLVRHRVRIVHECFLCDVMLYLCVCGCCIAANNALMLCVSSVHSHTT